MRPDSVPDLGSIQIIYLLTYLLTKTVICNAFVVQVCWEADSLCLMLCLYIRLVIVLFKNVFKNIFYYTALVL